MDERENAVRFDATCFTFSETIVHIRKRLTPIEVLVSLKSRMKLSF